MLIEKKNTKNTKENGIVKLSCQKYKRRVKWLSGEEYRSIQSRKTRGWFSVWVTGVTAVDGLCRERAKKR